MASHAWWLRAAADVLARPKAQEALDALADALRVSTGAPIAARVATRGDTVAFHIVGAGPRPAAADLPTGSDVLRHPLAEFHRERRVSDPVLLHEVVAAGLVLRRETRVLIERLHLTTHQLSVPVRPASEAGYTGWVLVSDVAISPSAAAELQAVQPLLRGLDLHVQLLRPLASSPTAAATGLTPRERVVLDLLQRGATAAGMAVRLGVSPRTVHKHLEHLYRKLGAPDRLSAVLRAQELGLLGSGLPPDSPPPDGQSSSSPPVHSSSRSHSSSSSSMKSDSPR